MGLFFVFFAYLLNLVFVFSTNNNVQLKAWWLIFSLLFFITLTGLFFNLFFLHQANNILPVVVFFDWFSVFNITFFSDLQLLSELYFNYSFFEFILMNIYLYFAIFIIYYLFSYKIILEHFFILAYQNTDLLRKRTELFSFIKIQNSQKQVQAPLSTRVWKKKHMYDSKKHMTKFGR